MPRTRLPKTPVDVDTLSLSETRKFNNLLGDEKIKTVTLLTAMIVQRKLIEYYPESFFRIEKCPF
jgi:hypothetical protein